MQDLELLGAEEARGGGRERKGDDEQAQAGAQECVQRFGGRAAVPGSGESALGIANAGQQVAGVTPRLGGIAW